MADVHEIRAIREDLRRLVKSPVLSEVHERGAYANDASIFQVMPAVVVMARSAEDVARVVRYAHERGIAVHPRGGGTGIAGECLGTGIVVDVSQNLRSFQNLSPDVCRVEPGLSWWELDRALARDGRCFPPDPVSGNRCTVGGMIATNAAGPHALKYGTTADYVVALEAVLPDGNLVRLEDRTLPRIGSGTEPAIDAIADGILSIILRHERVIEKEQPAGPHRPAGYLLRGLRDGQRLRLPRVLVGSEGTLAFITSADLATLARPRYRAILLVCFSSLEAASAAVIESLEYLPSACELLDRRLLSLIRDSSSAFVDWIPDSAEALLLLEAEGDSLDSVRDRIRLMENRLNRVTRLSRGSRHVYDRVEVDAVWSARHQASPRLSMAGGSERPTAFMENLAVHPTKLPEFIRAIQDTMKKFGVTACYSAHAGTGILHARPLLDLRRTDHANLLVPLSEAVADITLAMGGSLHAEHGIGLLRGHHLARQCPGLMPVFREIKTLFDPKGIMNPGRWPDQIEEHLPIDKLRSHAPAFDATSDDSLARQDSSAAVGMSIRSNEQLRWVELPMAEMVDRCNGCGSCLSRRTESRMCSSFKAMGDELSGPRAKANIIRQLFEGQIDTSIFASQELAELADTCVHCQMCKIECPSGVDVSRLVVELKAAHRNAEGFSTSESFFSQLEGWLAWGSANAFFVNFLLKSGLVRWFLSQTLGLSAKRELPTFHHSTFYRRAVRQGWTQRPRPGDPRPKVALLADLFVNHHDPHLGELAVRVLEKQKRRVYVPPIQSGSGMIPLVFGDIPSAKKTIESNIAVLAELARDGFDIVTLEPSSALMIREDAKYLSNDQDLEVLSRQTYEFSEYLAQLSARQEFNTHDLKSLPMTIAYHEPCHVRALRLRHSPTLPFAEIPDLRMVELDEGCSGMAGLAGFRTSGFERSVKSGESLLRAFAREEYHFGMSQCSSCRWQMQSIDRKRTLHPAHWLALSYGLVKRPSALLQLGR